jgi:NIL domain
MASENVLTNQRIRIRIPKDYHQEPVISRLVSDYGLTINISAAILGSDAVGDGWFDLDVKGSDAQLDSALTYLNDLDLEIWHNINTHSW